jgi:glycine/D-amino acid oxidase-like deaminating enzyme
VPLELWDHRRLAALRPSLPQGALAGLYSPHDGQIDAGLALDALLDDGERLGVERRVDRVESLAGAGGGGWRAVLRCGESLVSEWVVLAAGGGSAELLDALGASRPLQPVLGQALELELEEATAAATDWPAAVCWRGINLVPRPDLPGGRRFWIGATLEPGLGADPLAFARLLELEGAAPDWLRRARLLGRWQGLRQRPVGRPAPLLESIAPGLLLNGGHYRNGVLLAPACAEWVLERIQTSENVPLT